MKKRLNTVLGDIFFSYFPEGQFKNRIKCFIANKYLFRNLDFSTTYKNNVFYLNYHGNVYKFCDYPSGIYKILIYGPWIFYCIFNRILGNLIKLYPTWLVFFYT